MGLMDRFNRHHDYRNDTDDIIADSHHGTSQLFHRHLQWKPDFNEGPSLIYISPDPPTSSSFVKLWHSGKESQPFPQHMNMRIPAGLKAGPYLVRAEMIALHEGDVSYVANPKRGAQFYSDCVQIQVLGDGEVELPTDGVDFPGAYSYDDPGVVHNVRHLHSYSLPLLTFIYSNLLTDTLL
jgi:cellulase